MQFQGRVEHPINLPYELQDLTSRHTHYKQKAVQLIYLGSLYLTTFERIADRNTMRSLCERWVTMYCYIRVEIELKSGEISIQRSSKSILEI